MANENVTANIGFEKDIRIDFNVYGMHIIQENSTLSEENPHVCIGWSGLGDLSAINTKQELDDLYKLKNPSDSNQRKGANVSQIWMFIDTMKIGDYVVYFDGSTAHFGKVIGNYEYIEDMPNQSSDYVNNRKVEWIKDIAYNDLPKEYRNLYTYRSIFKLDTYKPLIEDILNGNEMVKDEFDDYEEELLLDYTIDELVELLKNLINKYSKKVVTIHLFGIKYGKLIRKKRYNAKEIINKAGLNDSYITELNKGISLSEFIDVVDNNKLICLDRELNNVENNDKKSFDYLSSTIKGGENLIVYGAPGCGKSFYVDYDKLGKNKSIGEYEGEFEKENIIRTTYNFTDKNDDFKGFRDDFISIIRTISIAKTLTSDKAKIESSISNNGFALNSYLWIIKDYLANGFYVNREKVFKYNQRGRVNWKRTLNNQPIISNGNVIYKDTVVEVRNELDNLLIEIHKYCVKKSVDLIGWLFGLSLKHIPQKPFNDIIKKRYLITIRQELDKTFDDYKKLKLNHMIKVIQGLDGNANDNEFVYGVNSWNLYFKMEQPASHILLFGLIMLPLSGKIWLMLFIV